jgi:hypothetical protein
MHSLSHLWRSFLSRHPFVANKRYHLFGLAVAFWPMILFVIEFDVSCHSYNIVLCHLFSSLFSILGIPILFFIVALQGILMTILPAWIAGLIASFLNPVAHYLFGMWLGHLLRKTSRNTQKRVLQFFFLTPILILFLFWRYG